ncbi:hypothetical protein OBK08_06745 [Empedobacter falsenii]
MDFKLMLGMNNMVGLNDFLNHTVENRTVDEVLFSQREALF